MRPGRSGSSPTVRPSVTTMILATGGSGTDSTELVSDGPTYSSGPRLRPVAVFVKRPVDDSESSAGSVARGCELGRAAYSGHCSSLMAERTSAAFTVMRSDVYAAIIAVSHRMLIRRGTPPV